MKLGSMPLALVVRRVNVQRAAFLGGLRLAPRLHPHGVRRSGRSSRPGSVSWNRHSYSVPGCEIQDAAGEAVGDRVVEILASPVDVLAADPHQRQRLSPGGFADRPELHATVAFRFASPVIAHSKPRFRSVGCSTWNRPASVAFWPGTRSGLEARRQKQ